jgi:hypothetical protein
MILPILVSIFATILFGLFAFQSIYPGDAGDLVTAASTFGVAHPPGYPLYTFLGWIITRVPILTAAWRMSWLSFIPHAIVLALVYQLVYSLTRKHIPAIFASLLLAGNYLFFLYSVTPEVFGLLNLFVIGLIVLSIRYKEKPTVQNMIPLFFAGGLSLTHHHLIAFLAPALFVYLKPVLLTKGWTLPKIAKAAGAFVLGLLPYLYVVVAGHGNSLVNWDKPTTLARFIQLITRADYGTFVTGGFVGRSLYERLLNVQSFFNFLTIDFTWIGVVLFGLGLWWLWKKNRQMFILLGLAFLFLGPGFVFYASFSTINRFVLGTYERFLLPSYVLFAIIAGIGSSVAASVIAGALGRISSSLAKSKTLVAICMLVLCIHPVVTGGMTLWRFWGSSSDQTSDRFVKDLLDSAPPNSIVLLVHDTALFGAQYMRYAQKYRPDTLVLHLARIPQPDYQEVIKKTNPDIVLPDTTRAEFISRFVAENSAKRPVVSNTIISTPPEWVWVPQGLVFVLMKKEEVPPPEILIAQNNALWESYGNPATGLLSRYNHLMLSNIRDEYASSAVAYGKTLVQSEQNEEAKKYFLLATTYDSDTERESSWMYLGLAQLFSDECNEALDSFGRSRELSLSPNPELLKYEAITYRDCVGDALKAKELEDEYNALKKKDEQPLDQL